MYQSHLVCFTCSIGIVLTAKQEASGMVATDPAKIILDDGKNDTYNPDLYHFDKVAPYVATLADITDEHIQFFREQGYLAVAQAFSKEEIDAALAGMLDLIDGKNPDFTGVQFERSAQDRLATLRPEEKQDVVRKIMWFVNYDDRLKALSAHPQLLAIVRRIVNGEPKMFQDMGLIKPPSGGREKPWHQDKAFFNLDIDAPVVGVWIAFDDATPENGCMHVLPGTHREGPVVHFKRRDWQICDTDVQTARDVMVPLKPGGCLFFDGLIHHGTPVNRTTTRRRAVQFHYTATDAAWLDQAYRLSLFGSEGKDVTC
jgi:phytanoyl-CoA hydroxylase